VNLKKNNESKRKLKLIRNNAKKRKRLNRETFMSEARIKFNDPEMKAISMTIIHLREFV
jgi:hypothetical protein